MKKRETDLSLKFMWKPGKNCTWRARAIADRCWCAVSGKLSDHARSLDNLTTEVACVWFRSKQKTEGRDFRFWTREKSFTLFPRCLLLSRTETLATQATAEVKYSSRKIALKTARDGEKTWHMTQLTFSSNFYWKICFKFWILEQITATVLFICRVRRKRRPKT